MNDCLKVSVAKERYGDQKRCRWLGHSSYKCAACKLGYVHVKSLTEYEEKCADCGALVFVERDYAERSF